VGTPFARPRVLDPLQSPIEQNKGVYYCRVECAKIILNTEMRRSSDA